MKTICLIASRGNQLDAPAKAKKLYVNSIFKACYRYAKILQPDLIFILSAKHGIVKPDDIVHPYDDTLNNKSKSVLIAWAIQTLDKLNLFCDLSNDKFIFLAGGYYVKHLSSRIKNYETPLEGVKMANQLHFLKWKTAEYQSP